MSSFTTSWPSASRDFTCSGPARLNNTTTPSPAHAARMPAQNRSLPSEAGSKLLEAGEGMGSGGFLSSASQCFRPIDDC